MWFVNTWKHVTRDLLPEVCVIRGYFVLGREISFSWGFSNNNWFKTAWNVWPLASIDYIVKQHLIIAEFAMMHWIK